MVRKKGREGEWRGEREGEKEGGERKKHLGKAEVDFFSMRNLQGMFHHGIPGHTNSNQAGN